MHTAGQKIAIHRNDNPEMSLTEWLQGINELNYILQSRKLQSILLDRCFK